MWQSWDRSDDCFQASTTRTVLFIHLCVCVLLIITALQLNTLNTPPIPLTTGGGDPKPTFRVTEEASPSPSSLSSSEVCVRVCVIMCVHECVCICVCAWCVCVWECASEECVWVWEWCVCSLSTVFPWTLGRIKQLQFYSSWLGSYTDNPELRSVGSTSIWARCSLLPSCKGDYQYHLFSKL